MTIQEVAAELKIDLNVELARYSGNQALYLKFLKDFPNDTSFSLLRQAMADRKYEEIERSAHALRQNAFKLGLEELYRSSSEIVEAVRQQEPQQLPRLFQQTSKIYDHTVEMIQELA